MRHAAAAALAVATLLAAPAAARAGDGTDLLGLVPDTATTIAVIDLADARDAPMYDATLGALLTQVPELSTGLAELGMTAADLDTLLVAFHVEGGRALDVAVIEGKFPRDALKRIGATATSRHRGVAYATSGVHDLALVKQRLLVTRTGEMKGLLDLVAGKKAKKPKRSVAGSPAAGALRSAIADTDTRHDLWLATVAEELAAMSRAQGAEVAAVSVGVTAGASLAIELRARFVDAAAATKVETLVTTALGQFGGTAASLGLGATIDSVTIARDGDRLELDVTIPDGELEALMMLARMI